MESINKIKALAAAAIGALTALWGWLGAAMLPSSVMMYHTNTMGIINPLNWNGSSIPGRLASTMPISRSAPAATSTTTTMPHLCQIPSRALAEDQPPPLQAAREPVR